MKVYNCQGNFYPCAKYIIHALFEGKQSLKLRPRFFCNRFLQILGPKYHSQHEILASKTKPNDSLYMFQKKQKQTQCRN